MCSALTPAQISTASEGTWDESNLWGVSLPIPLPGEFGTSSDCFVPHDGEVGRAGKVLSDGDRRVQVEDDVPPAACRHTRTHTHTQSQH